MGLGSKLKKSAGLIGTVAGGVMGGPAGAQLGGMVGGMLGGGGGPRQSGMYGSTVAPWEPAQQHLKDIMGGAQDLYKQGQGYTPEMKGYEQNALNQAIQYGQGGGNIGAAQQHHQNILSGNLMDPSSNPYTNQLLDQASNRAIGGVDSLMSRYGRTGSNAHMDQAIGASMKAQAPILNSFYNQGMNQMDNAMTNAGQMFQQGQMPMNQLMQLGGTERAYEQMPQNHQWNQLNKYREAVQPSGAMGSQTQQPYFNNPGAESMGKGMMLGSIASKMPWDKWFGGGGGGGGSVPPGSSQDWNYLAPDGGSQAWNYRS